MTPEFPGGLYHDDLPGGRGGATLRVLWDRVEARTPDGAVFHVPHVHLRLELGGATGRMLLVRGAPGEPVLFSETPGLFEAIRDTGGARTREACAACVAAVQDRRKGSRTAWIVGLAVVVLLVFAAPPAWRFLADHAVDGLPTSVDKQIGDLAATEIAQAGPVVTDPAVAGLVDDVVARLALGLSGDDAEFKFKAVVVENTAVNAFALPGGRIAVFTGLLRHAPTVDALAGVLGHEMSHVTGRHSVRHLVKSVGVVVVFNLLVGDASGLIALLGEGAAMAVLTGYSREQESAADHDGLALMAREGFDPAGLPAMFEVMKTTVPDAEAPEALQWLSTHPSLDERIAVLTAEVPGVVQGPKAKLTHTLEAAKAALSHTGEP